MQEIVVSYVWEPHGEFSNMSVRPGRWAAIGVGAEDRGLFVFLSVDLGYRPERLRECIERLEGCLSGMYGAGVVDGGNDGALYFGGGYVLFESDYRDGDRVLMTAKQALVLFNNVMATMDDSNYNNPHVEPFGSFSIELISTGETALEEYLRLGGSTG